MWLSHRLRRWARSWLSTQVVELAVHTVKTRANASDLGDISRAYRWAALIESDLLQDYCMDPLVAEQRDCAAALGTRDIPKDVFSAEYPENSMPTDHFESIMKRAGTGAFPQMAADAFHTNGLLWLSYVRAGSTAALRNCWFSVLAPVGCLLERLEGPTWRTLGLVLHACEFHVILWKPDTLEDGIHYTWKPRRRDAMWTLHQLRSLDYYRCRAVVPVSPAKTY